MNEQEMQSKLMELEILKQQLGQLDQQKLQFNAKKMDIEAAIQTLGDLGKSEGSIDAFVPIGSGIFSRVTLNDTDTVVVNVGANIAIEKPVKDAKSLMDEMVVGYEKMSVELDKDIQTIQNHAQTVYSMLEQAELAEKQSGSR